MTRGVEQYYALCVRGEEEEVGKVQIAFLHLRQDEELGNILGIAVYTAPDGEVQREHLQAYAPDEVFIAPVSHKELLHELSEGMPTSILLDGEKIAGSVFKGMIKDELGLPIKRPRVIAPQKTTRGQRGKGRLPRSDGRADS